MTRQQKVNAIEKMNPAQGKWPGSPRARFVDDPEDAGAVSIVGTGRRLGDSD